MLVSHRIEWDVSFVQELLDEMPQRDAFTWNSYYSHGLGTTNRINHLNVSDQYF